MQKFSGIAERDVAEEAEKFRDYWISIAGPRGIKLDWEATWRNWCRTGFAQGKREKNLSADEQKRRVIEEVLQRRAQADEREIES